MNMNHITEALNVLQSLYQLNPFPYWAMGAWLLFSIWYVAKAFRDYESINRYLLQMIPFVFTILGILGAISGSIGFIWGFSPEDLLSGSKTMFKGLLGSCATALAGIALSLLFGKLISMTHYKVEMRKALENNELFVLKRLLKLQLKAYGKDQKHAGGSLDMLKGVRHDVRALAPYLKRNSQELQEAVVSALRTPEAPPLSDQVQNLHQDLLRNTESMIEQGRRQEKLLQHIAASLSGTGERSLTSQLQAVRLEQRERGQRLETNMGALYEHLRTLNTKNLGQSLRAGLKDQTDALSRIISDQTRQTGDMIANRMDAADATRAHLIHMIREEGRLQRETMEKAAAETREAMIAATAEQRQHSERLESLLQESREQTDSLAALAAQILPGVQQTMTERMQTLHSRLTELEILQSRQGGESAKSLQALAKGQKQLTAALQEQRALVQEMREAVSNELARELARQQATAAAEAARTAVRSFKDSFAPQLQEWAAHLADIAQEQARQQGLHTAENMENAFSTKTKALADKLEQVTAQVQRAFERIEELGRRTDDLASDNKTLQELMHQANKALESGQGLQRMLEKLAASPAGNGKHFSANSFEPLGKSMTQLVSRLREVDAIKKKDERFWRKVERQMHDGIPIIMGGNKLRLDDDLNGSFTDRLQRSFNNLEKILETIVDGYHRKPSLRQ